MGQKAYLGISYSFRSNNKEGFTIYPERNSPAFHAGILDKDILLSVNGKKIKYEYQDWEMLKLFKPADVVTIEVKRGNKVLKLKATLAKIDAYNMKFPYVKKDGDPWLGLYFAYSQPYERKIEDGYLSVLKVIKGSPAEKAGFKVGDLIYDIPGMRKGEATFYSYAKLLEKKKTGDTIELKVLRDLKIRKTIVATVGAYEIDSGGF